MAHTPAAVVEAGDGAAVPEDHASAEKADAADDLGRYARRVGAVRPEHPAVRAQIGKAVLRHDHRHRGGDAHDDVRADACLLEATGALEADGRAAQRRHDDPQAEFQYLRRTEHTV